MEIKTHPIYDKYEFNTDGQFRRIGTKFWRYGSSSPDRKYLGCGLSSKNDSKQHSLQHHRAVWECFNNPIPAGYEIDHKNDIPDDNRLENLQCITVGENRKKAQKHNQAFRDKAKINNLLRRFIKSTNVLTYEIYFFNSKSQAGKYHGCSPALVYLICEGKNRAKTFNKLIKFEYVDEIDIDKTKLIIIPDARLEKMTDEQRIINKKEIAKKASKKQYEKKKLAKTLI